MDQPQFHSRRSVHPDAVARDRALLIEMAERSGIPGAELEVEALSDWQAVQRVEGLFKIVSTLAEGQRQLSRGFKGAAARMSALNEQLQGLAGAQLAEGTEMFLAIDHSD